MLAYYYYYFFQYSLNHEQIIVENRRIDTVEQGMAKGKVQFGQLRFFLICT